MRPLPHLALCLGLALFSSRAAAEAVEPRALTSPLTLLDCVRLAESNAPTAAVRQGRVRVDAGQLSQARTWPNPIYTYTAQDLALQSADGVPALLQQHTLTLSPFFAYARAQEARVASRQLERAQAASEDERRLQRLLTGRAYYDVLLAGRLAAIEEQAVAVARELVVGTGLRVARGDIGQLEVTRAQAEALEVERAAALWVRRSAQSQLALSVMLGAATPQSVALIEDWSAAATLLPPRVRDLVEQPTQISDRDRRELHSLALQHRPDLRQAVAEQRQAEEGRRLEQRRTLPLADVQLALAARITPLGVGALVSASTPIPLFDWNQGPRLRAAAQVEIGQALPIRAERQIRLEVDSALLEAQQHSQALTRSLRPVTAAREVVLAAVRRQFQAGTVALPDVIAAHRELLAARRSEAQGTYDAALALWQLALVLAVPRD